MQRFLALAATLLLAGCDLVTTTKPLVTASADAPVLRDGVWQARPEGRCHFDPKRSLRRWPKCANGFLIRGNQLAEPTPGQRSELAYTLSPGSPVVGQIEIRGKEDPTFFYEGVEATAFDAAGRIIGFRGWMTACGPAAADGKPTGTFPGLIRPPGASSGCGASSLEAVRNAAALSRVGPDLTTAHWVRDGDH
jgi:hypothetical protein